MPFKALFIAHAPDADRFTHRSVIDTGTYELFAVAVRNQAEALEVCREFVARERVDAILLCPGFTHRDVAEIAQAVGEGVAVCVARGDGPSNRVALAAMERAGFLRRE